VAGISLELIAGSLYRFQTPVVYENPEGKLILCVIQGVLSLASYKGDLERVSAGGNLGRWFFAGISSMKR